VNCIFLPVGSLSERFRIFRKGLEMQTELPFFDSPEDALKAAVQALGGAKAVGHQLWPDKGIDASARLLLDCLNPSRSEKLELSQIMRILSLAHQQGYHTAALWFTHQIGYDARPITPAEEVDRLTTVVETSAKTLAGALAALERIQNTNHIKAA
jgi:hypothetical protein